MAEGSPLLEVSGLVKDFVSGGGLFGGPRRVVRAVDDVSLAIREGETLGIVGESGCGKSTLGRLILRLIEPTAGVVRFEGRDVLGLGPVAMRALRRRMQMIFQDPLGALNPRLQVVEAIGEPMRVHGLVRDRDEERAKVVALLEKVGLGATHLRRYPHELSGGQRQRVVIARALAVEPRFVVCDEPVAALDVSVQAQVVNLLRDLQDELGLSYLFVAHDLAVVRLVSRRVAVMYLGRIVEHAAVEALYETPLHPYTKALLASAPTGDPDRPRLHAPLSGEPPSPSDPSLRRGCAFHARCPVAEKGRCDVERPPLRTIRRKHEEPREVACHLVPDG
ncbi:MAG: dipeptide ABC transporter ATP-binding protein [Sandaracinaceae bacterium]